MRAKRRLPVLLLLALCLGASSVRAQTRNERIAQAFSAYDNFQAAQAMDLLKVAVNPSEGPSDSLWFRAVQLIAQILIEDNKSAEAGTWLRWALRQSPTATIDSVTFVPEVVSAARDARDAARSPSPGDPVTRTTWQWNAPGAGEGRGILRVDSPGMAQPVRALVRGIGQTESGRSLTVPAGTYEVQAAAEGYLTAQVRREVLPGVTTVLSFNLTPVAAAVTPTPTPTPPPQIAPPAPAPTPAAAPTLSEASRAAVSRQFSPFTVQRFGMGPACGTAAFVGRSGLLLTSYRGIRGAEHLEVELSGGRREELRVAAYDVGADAAVLQSSAIRADSLLLGSASSGQPVWAFGFQDCRSPRDVQTAVVSASATGLQLADSLASEGGIGPLVNASGAVVGFLTGPRAAVSGSRLAQVVEQARRNVSTADVLGVGQIALRENHAYGTVTITSDLTGAEARITPLETWQWPGTATSGSLPLTFSGPMGRYHLRLVSPAGQVQRETDFTVRPAVADRLSVPVQPVAQLPQPAAPGPAPAPAPQAKKKGGGSGVILAIVGIGGAGAAVCLLAVCKSKGPGPTPPPTTSNPGSITITVPNPSVAGLIVRLLTGRGP